MMGLISGHGCDLCHNDIRGVGDGIEMEPWNIFYAVFIDSTSFCKLISVY